MNKLIMILSLMLFSLQAGAGETATALFQTINERLSYMEDVALFKSTNHLPIENVERERVVIAKARKSATKEGLDADSIEQFFKSQISVAKAIQYRCRADLLSRPTSKKFRDLKTEVRPALLRLGDDINRQMSLYVKERGSLQAIRYADFSAALTTNYIKETDKKLLFTSLQGVKASAVK